MLFSVKSCYLWIWNFQGEGGTKWKNHGNSRGVGGGGNTMKPLGNENPGGWRYGYFLEPHNLFLS